LEKQMSIAEEIFDEELLLIKDDEIRKFVLLLFENLAPDYFWTVPSSTSGKHHPEVSLGKGGLVRHTKLAVWWAKEFIRMYDLELSEYNDEIIAATLLHDLKKNGETVDNEGKPTLENYTSMHGIYLGEQIEKLLYNLGRYPSLREHRIIEAVKTHMGRWSADTHCHPTSQVGNIVHFADYCSSRKVDEKIKQLLENTT
jgi:hypothetical protein